MKPKLLATLSAVALAGLLAVLVGASISGAAKPPKPAKPPQGFFGIGPQTTPTAEDARYMRAGGIESVRIPVSWSAVQPTRKGGYDWTGLDETIATLANARLRILPVILGTPAWLARDWRTLPVNNGRQRSAWQAFLKAAVKRYGPGGDFWRERAPGVVEYVPEVPRPLPIREWQIWNEANFFYFTAPVSPTRYAKLVEISSRAIKSVHPGAQVILAGLFGEPQVSGSRGMDAADFLDRLYRKPGIASRFDGASLHPYAVFAKDLERMVEDFYAVTRENGDRPRIYVTEMGWGSQNNFRQVAYEQGVRGQVKQLKDSYAYLLENQRRLNLKGVYWFSWKDLDESCSFCDSVGFFHGGERFKPKPAWRAFVGITGGRARP